jgi:hypothetical protein
MSCSTPLHAIDAIAARTPSTHAVDAGTGKARSFDLAGAALRLLALCDGNGYILARDARLVDYDSEDAPACDVNDAAHANAAAIHTRRQLALRPVETEGERKPSRADRLKRRAALPRHDGPISFDDRGSDGETKKRKRPRPSPQTRDAALLVERAAPIAVRQENPKKGKSAERYELYKAATTAREYVALGGTKADLKYDIQRGWVTVLAPPVTAEGAPAPAAPAEAGGSPGSSASVDSAPRSTDPVAYLPEVPAWPSPAKEPLPTVAASAPPAPARRE